jgi:hypothetical protein
MGGIAVPSTPRTLANISQPAGLLQRIETIASDPATSCPPRRGLNWLELNENVIGGVPG